MNPDLRCPRCAHQVDADELDSGFQIFKCPACQVSGVVTPAGVAVEIPPGGSHRKFTGRVLEGVREEVADWIDNCVEVPWKR